MVPPNLKIYLFGLVLFGLSFSSFISCSKGDDRCEEAPAENCLCNQAYIPVCGCNQVTYGNACEAECRGITEYTSGECQK